MTNLLVLFNLDSSLQYDGKLKLMRPMRLNTKKKVVKCEWSATVELRTVDLSRPVGPEYQHGKDLPISGQDDLGQQDGSEQTGTDDAD